MKKTVLKLVFCLPLLLIGITLLLVKNFLWGIVLIGSAILIYKLLNNANETQMNNTIKTIFSIIGIIFVLIIISPIISSELIFILFCILLFVLNCYIWGKICQFVAVNKGYSPKFFWLGVVFELLGLLIVGFLRDNTVTKNNNDIGSLEQLAELKEQGIITEQEFEESKKKILRKL